MVRSAETRSDACPGSTIADARLLRPTSSGRRPSTPKAAARSPSSSCGGGTLTGAGVGATRPSSSSISVNFAGNDDANSDSFFSTAHPSEMGSSCRSTGTIPSIVLPSLTMQMLSRPTSRTSVGEHPNSHGSPQAAAKSSGAAPSSQGAVVAAIGNWNRRSSLQSDANATRPKSSMGGSPSSTGSGHRRSMSCVDSPASDTSGSKRHTFQLGAASPKTQTPKREWNSSARPVSTGAHRNKGETLRPASHSYVQGAARPHSTSQLRKASSPAWGAGAGPRLQSFASGGSAIPAAAASSGSQAVPSTPPKLQIPGKSASGSAGGTPSSDVPSPSSPSIDGPSVPLLTRGEQQSAESGSVTIRGGRIGSHGSGGAGTPLGGLVSPSESQRSSMGAPGTGGMGGVGYVAHARGSRAMERFSSPASPTRAAMASPSQRSAAAAAVATRSGSITAGAVSSPSSGPSGAFSELGEGRCKPRLKTSSNETFASGNKKASAPDATADKDKARSSSMLRSSNGAAPQAAPSHTSTLSRRESGVATSGTATTRGRRQSMTHRIAAVGGRGLSPSQSESASDVSHSTGTVGGASGGRRRGASAATMRRPMATSSTFHSAASTASDVQQPLSVQSAAPTTSPKPTTVARNDSADHPTSSVLRKQPNPSPDNLTSCLVFFPSATESLPLEPSPETAKLKGLERSSVSPKHTETETPGVRSSSSRDPEAVLSDSPRQLSANTGFHSDPPSGGNSPNSKHFNSISGGSTSIPTRPATSGSCSSAAHNGVTFDLPHPSEDTPVLNQDSASSSLVLTPHVNTRPLSKPPPIVGIPPPSVSNASSPTQSPRLSPRQSPRLSPPGQQPYLSPRSQPASLNASPANAAVAAAQGSPVAAWPPPLTAFQSRRASYPASLAGGGNFPALLPFTPLMTSQLHSAGANSDGPSPRLISPGGTDSSSVGGLGSFLPHGSNPLASGCLYKQGSAGGVNRGRSLGLDGVDSCVSAASQRSMPSSHRSMDSCALPGFPNGGPDSASSRIGSSPAMSRHSSVNTQQHAMLPSMDPLQLHPQSTPAPGTHLSPLHTRSNAGGSSGSGSGSSPHKPAHHHTASMAAAAGSDSMHTLGGPGGPHRCSSACSSLAAVHLNESTTDESTCRFDSGLSVINPPPAAHSSRFDHSGSLLAESCTSNSQPTSHLHRGPHSHSPRCSIPVPSSASPAMRFLNSNGASTAMPPLATPGSTPFSSHSSHTTHGLHASSQHGSHPAGLDRLSTIPSSGAFESPRSPTPSSQHTNHSHSHHSNTNSNTTSPDKLSSHERSSMRSAQSQHSGSSPRSPAPGAAPPSSCSPRQSPRDPRRQQLHQQQPVHPLGGFARAALSTADGAFPKALTGLDPETMSDFAKQILSERVPSFMPFPVSDSAAHMHGGMHMQQLFAAPHSPPSARTHLKSSRRTSATNPTTTTAANFNATTPAKFYDSYPTLAPQSLPAYPAQQRYSTGSQPHTNMHAQHAFTHGGTRHALSHVRSATVLAPMHPPPMPQPSRLGDASRPSRHHFSFDAANSEDASSAHLSSSAPLSVTAAVGGADGSVSPKSTSPSCSPHQTPASSGPPSPTCLSAATTPRFPHNRLSPPPSTTCSRSSLPSLDSVAFRDVTDALEGPNIQPRRGITRSASVPPPACTTPRSSEAWPFNSQHSVNYRPRSDRHLDIFGGVTDPSLGSPGRPINSPYQPPGLVTSESGPHLALQYIGTAPPPRPSTQPSQPPDFDAFFRSAPPTRPRTPPDFDAFFRSAPAAASSSSMYPPNPMFAHAYSAGGPNGVMSNNSNSHLEPTSGASAASSLARSPTHPFRPRGATCSRRRSASMLHALPGSSAEHIHHSPGQPSPLAPLELADMHGMHLPPRHSRGDSRREVSAVTHLRASARISANLLESSGAISPCSSLPMAQHHSLSAEDCSAADASASISAADTSTFSVSAACTKRSGTSMISNDGVSSHIESASRTYATGSDCSLRHWKRSNAGGDTFVSLPLPEEQETSDIGGSEYMAISGSMHDGSMHGSAGVPLQSRMRTSTQPRLRNKRHELSHTDAADSLDDSSGSFLTPVCNGPPPKPGSPSGLPPPAPRGANRIRTSLNIHGKAPLMHPSGHQDASRSSLSDSFVATPSDSPTMHDAHASRDASIRPECGSSPSQGAERDNDAHLFRCMGPACVELRDVPLVVKVLTAGGKQGVTHLQFSQNLAQLSAHLAACITHLIPGRTGQLRRGMQAQMPGLVDDLDSLQLASHLSAKYEQAALSGASSQMQQSVDGPTDSSSPKPHLPEWPNVSAALPVCLSYLAAAFSAASAGEWLQCISHLVALQRLTALESASHAALAALSRLAAASAAAAAAAAGRARASKRGGLSTSTGSEISSLEGPAASFTATSMAPGAFGEERERHSRCDSAGSNSLMSASSAFVGAAPMQGRNAYRKVFSNNSSASDSRNEKDANANHTTAGALVRQSLMLEDSGSGMQQNSGIEIMFPMLDAMFQTVPQSAAAAETSGGRSSTDEMNVDFEIFDTEGTQGSRGTKLSADAATAAVNTPRMVGMSTAPVGTLGGREMETPVADAAPAAAAASDAVLGALARAVDAELPHLAGIGAGPSQVHLSMFVTHSTHSSSYPSNGDETSSSPVVMVHISPAALPTSAEVALASANAAAWAAAPDVPDPCTHAFEQDNYQTPECMLGVRKALGEALRCARGSAAGSHTVWRGAAAKLRPEALSVVTSEHVSPQMFKSSDSGGSVTSAMFAACRAPDDPTLDVEEAEVAERLIWPFELISAAAETIARCAAAIVAASAAGSHWPPQYQPSETPYPTNPTIAHIPRTPGTGNGNGSAARKRPVTLASPAARAAPEQAQHKQALTLPVFAGDASAPTPDLSFSRPRRNSNNGAVVPAATAPVAGYVCDPPMGAPSCSDFNPAATYCHYSPSLQDMLKQETVRHVRDAGLHPTSPSAGPAMIPMAQSPVGHHFQGSLFHTSNTDLDGFAPLDTPLQQPASPSVASSEEPFDGVASEIPCASPSQASGTPTGTPTGTGTPSGQLSAHASQVQREAYRTAHSADFSTQQLDTSSEEGDDVIRDIAFPESTGNHEFNQDPSGSCLGGLTSLPSVGLGPQLPVPSSNRSYKTTPSSLGAASGAGGVSRQSSTRLQPGSQGKVQLSPRGGPSSSGTMGSTGGGARGARRVRGQGHAFYYPQQEPLSSGGGLAVVRPHSSPDASVAMSMSTTGTMPAGDVLAGEPGAEDVAMLGRQGQTLMRQRLQRAGMRPPPSALRTCFCLHSHVEDSQELS